MFWLKNKKTDFSYALLSGGLTGLPGYDKPFLAFNIGSSGTSESLQQCVLCFDGRRINLMCFMDMHCIIFGK